MKSEFPTMRLATLAEIQTGPFGSQLHKEDYVSEGTPIVTVEHLGNKNFTEQNLPCVSDKDRDRLKKYILQEGDIVFSRVGSVDRCSFVSKRYSGWMFSGRCLRVRPRKMLNAEYLYYFFLLESTKQFVRNIATGATMPSINTKFMGEVPVAVPPLDVQEEIVKVLRNLDDKIQLNTEINKNLEQQAQALYKSWFVDFEPFNGTKPDDWNYGIVDDLANEIICGKTPSTKVADYYGSDIPFITIPDMHGNVYTVSTERYLSLFGAQSQAKKMLPKNSICVSCIGTAGLVTLVATESQTNQQINSIIPKNGYSPFYIYLLMQTLSEVINKLGQSGSTIVNLNKAQFSKIQVLVPSVTSMKEFDGTVSPLFSLILENQKENIRLSSLRDTLLPKLMSGEIDVSDLDL